MNVTDLSVMTLWTAALLYSIAMVAYSVRLARVADDKVASRRELVAVGAATGSARGGGETAEADVAPGRAKASAKALGIARATTFVGLAAHAIGVAARGVDAGHVPWSTMYEFTISGSLVAVAVFVLVQRRRDVIFLAPGVTGLATFALVTALRVLYRDATGLQPALQSFWLVIHVSIAVTATGVFAVGGVASTLQLMRTSRAAGPRPRPRALGWVNAFPRLMRRWTWLEATPTPGGLEALAFRLNAVGFVLWTFTVMAGAIWAEHAWGRYWGWDPKEIWSFVIWVVYAAYLHARTTQGWSGARAAWLSLAGLIAVVMNFTVVNLVFQGLHSYAGVK